MKLLTATFLSSFIDSKHHTSIRTGVTGRIQVVSDLTNPFMPADISMVGSLEIVTTEPVLAVSFFQSERVKIVTGIGSLIPKIV